MIGTLLDKIIALESWIHTVNLKLTLVVKNTYINEIRNFNYRRSITRFRISAHRLKIETGRYIKLDRSERLCTKCSTGAIEDEQHFLMECSKFNAFRNSFFSNH